MVQVFMTGGAAIPLLAIAAVTALVGVAAVFVPARRTARMNPLVDLRDE